jgi:hypothetical protein
MVRLPRIISDSSPYTRSSRKPGSGPTLAPVGVSRNACGGMLHCIAPFGGGPAVTSTGNRAVTCGPLVPMRRS